MSAEWLTRRSFGWLVGNERDTHDWQCQLRDLSVSTSVLLLLLLMLLLLLFRGPTTLLHTGTVVVICRQCLQQSIYLICCQKIDFVKYRQKALLNHFPPTYILSSHNDNIISILPSFFPSVIIICFCAPSPLTLSLIVSLLHVYSPDIHYNILRRKSNSFIS